MEITSPLEIPEILLHIFSYIPIRDFLFNLKEDFHQCNFDILRQVCKDWNVIALGFMRTRKRIFYKISKIIFCYSYENLPKTLPFSMTCQSDCYSLEDLKRAIEVFNMNKEQYSMNEISIRIDVQKYYDKKLAFTFEMELKPSRLAHYILSDATFSPLTKNEKELLGSNILLKFIDENYAMIIFKMKQIHHQLFEIQDDQFIQTQTFSKYYFIMYFLQEISRALETDCGFITERYNSKEEFLASNISMSRVPERHSGYLQRIKDPKYTDLTREKYIIFH